MILVHVPNLVSQLLDLVVRASLPLDLLCKNHYLCLETLIFNFELTSISSRGTRLRKTPLPCISRAHRATPSLHRALPRNLAPILLGRMHRRGVLAWVLLRLSRVEFLRPHRGSLSGDCGKKKGQWVDHCGVGFGG